MRITREYLEDLANPKILSIDHIEIMTMKSLESRGYSYYGCLKTEFPFHWSSFCNMQNRVKYYNLESDFNRDVEGFIEFILYLGEVPKDMIDPTLGRENHSLGYVKGNFKWQSLADNSSESARRNFTGVKRPFLGDPLWDELKEIWESLDRPGYKKFKHSLEHLHNFSYKQYRGMVNEFKSL